MNKISLIFGAPFLIIAPFLLFGCHNAQSASTAHFSGSDFSPASHSKLFDRDIAQSPGIDFVDVAAEAGIKYEWKAVGARPLNILQTIGNGCAFLDYDNDGNLDILLIGPKLALFEGDGKGHFTDVTVKTGMDRVSGHSLGVAVGDFDNDGFDDLYITAYRGGILMKNMGERASRM